MRLFALVVLAATEFDDADLVALAVTLHRGNHLGRTHEGSTDCDRGSGPDQQHLIEFDAGALVCVELLNTHHGTLLNAVLFTARGNHGIHLGNSESGITGPQKSRELYGLSRLTSNLAFRGTWRSPLQPAAAATSGSRYPVQS